MLGSYEEMGKKMIEVITSFNEYYYNLIGKDSVESWLNNWSEEFKMTCYVEEFKLPFANDRITEIDFEQLDSDYTALQADNLHSSIKRFAKKAYSFMHAMHHSKSNWIIWLDADVITTGKVDWSVMGGILNPYHLAMYMGVRYQTDKDGRVGDWLVPETGVFAVNTQHPDFKAFRAEYFRRYKERDYEDLRRFYDNDVFGAALRLFPDTKVTDLCAKFVKGYRTPLRHTVLGPYLFHHKAKHSKDAYSNRTDFPAYEESTESSNSQYEDEQDL